MAKSDTAHLYFYVINLSFTCCLKEINLKKRTMRSDVTLRNTVKPECVNWLTLVWLVTEEVWLTRRCKKLLCSYCCWSLITCNHRQLHWNCDLMVVGSTLQHITVTQTLFFPGETLDSWLENHRLCSETLEDPWAERWGAKGATQISGAGLCQRIAAQPHAAIKWFAEVAGAGCSHEG